MTCRAVNLYNESAARLSILDKMLAFSKFTLPWTSRCQQAQVTETHGKRNEAKVDMCRNNSTKARIKTAKPKRKKFEPS